MTPPDPAPAPARASQLAGKPFIRLGRILRERRMSMDGLTSYERSQTGFAQRAKLHRTLLARIENGHENLAGYRARWFEDHAWAWGWTAHEMMDELGLHFLKDRPTPSEAALVERMRGELPVFRAGATRLHPADARAMGRCPEGLPPGPAYARLQVTDDAMEPHLTRGSLVTIALDPDLIRPYELVAVSLDPGGVQVRWYVPDGDREWLARSNPDPSGPEFRPLGDPRRLVGSVMHIERVGSYTRPGLVDRLARINPTKRR